ncbi:hypothetical protein Tco_0281709 [Tanacetum coccineum]
MHERNPDPLALVASHQLENISEAELTEAEQLKVVLKRSRLETHSSHASGSGADEGTGITPGVPDAPDYDSEDDISWKSSDDEQDDEQDQEDDDADDDNKKAEDDDDEEMTESDNDGDDFVHPKLTTHEDEIIHEKDTDEDDSSISTSDEDDSDNDDEGANVAGAKSDKNAIDEQDQGNEEVKDTNTDLDGRDKVLTDVEDTHVTLTPVNPDGRQQSSSVSSGFVSNMLNPNQDTGVDDIFRQHTEATSLIDTNVTAIVEPFFTRPPTPHPIIIQPQQLPIMSPATTTSSLLQNLPNFASLFGFDSRLKALEDNFSEFKQTNQYAEALSSIPSTVDQYLAHKMQEAVDVAVQLKNKSKKEVSKIIPKVEKIDTEQLDLDQGSQKKKVRKGTRSTSAPSETETKTAGKTTSTGSKTHTKSASQSAPVGDAMHSTDVFKGPADQEFKTGVQDEQAEEEVQHLPDWFQKPTRLPSPDHAWNTSVPAVHETVQPWLSNLAHSKTLESAGPTFELMKGTCKSLTELEYFCEEVYKATTEKLDWINPEGRQYPHDLRQPLPLVPNSKVSVLPFHHFINNDQEYLRGGVISRKYSTSVTETKAGNYDINKKDRRLLVPNQCGVKAIDKYDKFVPLGNLQWGKKRRRSYGICTLKGISTGRTKVMMMFLYRSKKALSQTKDPRHEDMLPSSYYQKNLPSPKPDTYRSNLRRQDAYTPYSDPRGFIYENKDKKNRLMRIDELHKFSDGTLDDVRTVLNDRLKGIRMEYLPQTFWSQRDKANARAMIQARLTRG